MGDIRLQLARYAQGIHWVQKNFMLDESIRAVLVTAGHMDLLAAPQKPGAGSPDASQAPHVVLQMQPQFDVPFPAPESWNQQVPFPTCCLLSETIASLSLGLAYTFKSRYALLEFVTELSTVCACMHWASPTASPACCYKLTRRTKPNADYMYRHTWRQGDHTCGCRL